MNIESKNYRGQAFVIKMDFYDNTPLSRPNKTTKIPLSRPNKFIITLLTNIE